jgi:hypothetical protein
MRTIPTGRGIEIVETGQPTHCPNGHELAGNVVVGYSTSPDGGRARCYSCKTCWAVVWDEPT